MKSKDVIDLTRILKTDPLSDAEILLLPQLEVGQFLFNLHSQIRFLLKIF